MSHIYRLLFALAFALIMKNANALSKVTIYWMINQQSIEIISTTKEGLCNKYSSTFNPGAGKTLTGVTVFNNWYCLLGYKTSTGATGEMMVAFDSKLGCPDNASAVGTSCQCNSGFNEVNGQCVKPDTGDKRCEDLAIIWNSTLTPDRSGRVNGALSEFADGKTVCHDPGPDAGLPAGQGCKHKFTGDFGYQDGEGKWVVNGWSLAHDSRDKAELGGSLSCSLVDPLIPKEEDQPEDCRAGYKGQVNGIDVCIEAWTGKTEGIDWTRVNDAEGNETDTKTTVTCKGDQCTIKEEKTTKKPGGGTTTTTTIKEDVNRQGYCARNPKSAICGRKEDDSSTTKGQDGKGKGDGNGDGEEEKSSFSGSCAASFVCEGDAITCAIAKEQHLRNCKLYGPDDDANSFTNKALAGTDGYGMDKLKSEAQQVAIGTFDQNGLGWSHGCPADPSIPLNFGRSAEFSIPFSRICGPLGVLSMAGVGITLLGSMVWVLGGRNNRG